MKTVYIATIYGSITPKNIVRETDSSIFILGHKGKEERQAKETSGSKTFNELQDAVNFVIVNQKEQLRQLENRYNSAKQKLSESQAKSLEDWIK